MANSFNKKDVQPKDLQQIPKWTRRYAQNRTIPFLVFMVIFVLLSIAIGVPSHLGGKAYRLGNMLAFWVCVSILVLAFAAVIFFSLWGDRLIERISQRLYGSEGVVSLPPPERIKKHPWVGWVAGLIFGSCVLASVVLGASYIPIEYMQPVSALYVVPFLVFLAIWQRPMSGPGSLALLWPILYALHAILVVAGVPIQFGGKWQSLNMLIPIAGYGLLSGLIGHIYSRYALRKLKKVAHFKENER